MQKEAHVFNKAVDEARQQQIIELGQKLEGQLGALGEKAGALHQEKQNVEKDCADLQRQLDAVQSKMQQIGALKRKLQSKKEQIARRCAHNGPRFLIFCAQQRYQYFTSSLCGTTCQ
eukprot:SAG31_NODE_206_length_20335_cov_17.910160_18_plen_117_part_00